MAYRYHPDNYEGTPGDLYQEKFWLILPTAGMILDMGRTLDHKKIIVKMALSGHDDQGGRPEDLPCGENGGRLLKNI